MGIQTNNSLLLSGSDKEPGCRWIFRYSRMPRPTCACPRKSAWKLWPSKSRWRRRSAAPSPSGCPRPRTLMFNTLEVCGLRRRAAWPNSSVVEIFKRFAAATEGIQKVLKAEGYDFMHNDHLGWVLTCPSNLGTGLRAGAMVKVPHFSARKDFRDVMGRMGLQARGTAGVDSASTGGTWDISNADRLGKSETQLVNIFIEGVAQIIRWEQDLEAGKDIEAEVAKASLPAKF